jgi:hypothetical protein
MHMHWLLKKQRWQEEGTAGRILMCCGVCSIAACAVADGVCVWGGGAEGGGVRRGDTRGTPPTGSDTASACRCQGRLHRPLPREQVARDRVREACAVGPLQRTTDSHRNNTVTTLCSRHFLLKGQRATCTCGGRQSCTNSDGTQPRQRAAGSCTEQDMMSRHDAT